MTFDFIHPPAIENRLASYTILLVCSIPLFFLCISNVHPWGDDYSQYIKEALNIAHGKPFYQSGYIFNKYNSYYAPPQYPPGYPLLLAPIVAIWGLSIKAMLYYQTIFYVALLIAFYEYFRKFISATSAICIALLLIYSGGLIDIKRSLLADIPCLLFVVMYLTARETETFSWRRIAFLVFCLTAAVLTRSQTILLAVAEGGWIAYHLLKAVLQKRTADIKVNLLPLVYVLAGFALLFVVLNKIVFAVPVATNDFYGHFLKLTLHTGLWNTIDHNIGFLIAFIKGSFYYTSGNHFIIKAIAFIQRCLLFSCCIGFIISVVNKVKVSDIFFLCMCGLILFLPVQDSRYFLPALPVIIYYCLLTFKAIVKWIKPGYGRRVAIPATIILLLSGSGYFAMTLEKPCEGCIPIPREYQAFDYIKQHVKDDEIIVFPKPRMLTLYTGKRCMNVSWELPPAGNKKIFDSLNVKYMLVLKYLEDDFMHQCIAQEHVIDSTPIADGYMLYRVR